METKVAKVLQLLGDNQGIKESEIRETLWYYYFDVERTVSWLLGSSINSTLLILLETHAGQNVSSKDATRNEPNELATKKGRILT
jgi:hypothetical protein